MNTMNSDQLILDMIQENNDYAFVLLYKKYWKPLMSFAGHYLEDKDSCEEIIQQLFIQLHARRSSLKINSSVSAYLYAALRNKILNHIRNQAVYKKHITIAAHSANRIQNNVDQFIYMKELEQEISFSLNQMPIKCKEVYLLHDQDQFTIKKISELLSRPVDTVEKQLRRAKKLLRSHLLPQGHQVLWKNKQQVAKKRYAIRDEGAIRGISLF